MNIIFTGPPLAGKGTQAQLLGDKLGLPVLSIGALLREAMQKGDEVATKGYTDYAMKGHFLPISLKFYLLKEKLDSISDGFILENFPSTQEDLNTFLAYLEKRSLHIDYVFNISASEEETDKRMEKRGRLDDKKEIVSQRRINQEKDRVAVTDFYRAKGLLIDINGEGTREEVHKRIIEHI